MPQHILGIMSGTSCDGLDFCLSSFSKNNNKWEYQIHQTAFYPYSQEWKNKLLGAYFLSGKELIELEISFTKLQYHYILEFEKEFPNLQIDAIATHGHTVYHNPNEGYTLQITKGDLLSQLTKNPVVCNFRQQDVILGGQGAPLVPIGDQLLFSKYEACINLGGFANISLERQKERIAWDLCPFNHLLNREVSKMGLEYDNGGQIAQSGKLNEALLDKLNCVSYYSKKTPKSLSIENLESHFWAILDNFNQLSTQDKLHTLCVHFTEQISKEIDHKKNVLITGGGTYNQFFINKLREQTSCEIMIPNKELIDFKEALIFAFLGFLRFKNQINILSSVTGSLRDHSSGTIFYPI
ncbi:MAG: anhydro-N-acetylmuramic acid kinase [Flavobacteriales bacterium]|nr:anhydro-N-acetylmuramic acid kinase [Flavobacteriales bacterium]